MVAPITVEKTLMVTMPDGGLSGCLSGGPLLINRIALWTDPIRWVLPSRKPDPWRRKRRYFQPHGPALRTGQLFVAAIRRASTTRTAVSGVSGSRTGTTSSTVWTVSGSMIGMARSASAGISISAISVPPPGATCDFVGKFQPSAYLGSVDDRFVQRSPIESIENLY
jgi:hypothetical protein